MFGVHAENDFWQSEAIPSTAQMRLGKHWVAGSPFAQCSESSNPFNYCNQDWSHAYTFARFYILSAAPQGDCENGSGWKHGQHQIEVGNSSMRFLPAGTHRYGEAQHPGPKSENLLRLGVSNTTGVRRKEKHILDMGVGIWHLTETHLTKATSRTSVGQFKHLARQQNREVRCVTGAPVPIRSNSSWAGMWTGVAVLADFPTSPIQIQWQQEHWDSARIMMSRTWVGSTPITSATFYGYPTSPTWPQSRELSDAILAGVTRELVYGCGGVRTIAGDFNSPAGQLPQQRIWADMGWRNAQEVSAELFGHEWCPTFNQTTEPDQIWLSPEAISLLRGISIEEHFVGHSSVIVEFEVPQKVETIYRWPRPSAIPWKDLPGFQEKTGEYIHLEYQTTTESYGNWAKSLEEEIAKFADETLTTQLPPHCRGRAQRHQPISSIETVPILKASRQGEITISNDLVGSAVRQWFTQARRLQSMCHAVRAQKMTPQAIEYRASLWACIKRARGFNGGFEQW